MTLSNLKIFQILKYFTYLKLTTNLLHVNINNIVNKRTYS
jgi:hypothetical protein